MILVPAAGHGHRDSSEVVQVDATEVERVDLTSLGLPRRNSAVAILSQRFVFERTRGMRLWLPSGQLIL